MKLSIQTLCLCVGVALPTWLACAAPLHTAERKPNFIFVISDDHRWDAMGAVQREHGENARYAQPSANLVKGITTPSIQNGKSVTFDAWPKSLKNIAVEMAKLAK